MIKFSEKTQAFYAIALNYSDLPDDLVDVTCEKHVELLELLNAGHHIYSNLTYSEKRPSTSHVWQDDGWIDSMTSAQKYENYLNSLRPLTRRQFMLTLIEHNLDDDIEVAISNIEDTKQRKIINIEYKHSQSFERLSESVLFMCNLIELEEQKLNIIWEYGLRL